jgi:site-specific DNA recombinase
MSLSDLLKSKVILKPGVSSVECARAYVRVSHERSAEKNISPETQRKQIEAYAQAHNYNIIQWYVEQGGASAFRESSERPAFNQMMNDAKADPHTSVILVAYYDRFSRTRTAPAQQAELLTCGVRIESATEGYYDPETESGIILSGVTWSMSHLFSLKIRNRVIPCMKTNFEQRDPETGWAYKNGGWAQWGYKKHRLYMGKGKRSKDIYKVIWMLDDTIVAGKTVHEWARTMLIEWRLGERLGYDSIAARLTAAGVPTPMGKSAWSNSSIQSLIGDWTRLYQYAGYAFWNREDCTQKGNRVLRDTSEWIVVTNAHQAIITEEECDAINAMTSDRVRTKTNGQGKLTNYALSGGLLKCSICGSNYSSTQRGATRYYLCGSHLYRRGECCGASWYIPQEMIENSILRVILESIPANDTELRDYVNVVNSQMEEDWKIYRSTAGSRKNDLKQLEDKLNRYLDIVGSNGANEEIKARIDDVSAAIARLRRIEEVKKPEKIKADSLKDYREEVEKALLNMNPSARLRILKQVVIEAVADAETKKLSVRLNDPRSFMTRYMAVPRGVDGSRHIHAQNVIEVRMYLRKKRFWWNCSVKGNKAAS